MQHALLILCTGYSVASSIISRNLTCHKSCGRTNQLSRQVGIQYHPSWKLVAEHVVALANAGNMDTARASTSAAIVSCSVDLHAAFARHVLPRVQAEPGDFNRFVEFLGAAFGLAL